MAKKFPQDHPLSKDYSAGLYKDLDFNDLDYDIRVGLGLYAEKIFHKKEHLLDVFNRFGSGIVGKLDRVLILPLDEVLSLDNQKLGASEDKFVLYMSQKRLDPKIFEKADCTEKGTKEYLDGIKSKIHLGQASSL